LGLATSDSWLSSFRTRIRAYGTTRHAQQRSSSRPFSFIRTLTVGFGITPNLLTLLPKSKKALAGLGLFTLTAGGDFHPALRTSAARLNGLHGTMPKPSCASKRDSCGNPHGGHDGKANFRAKPRPVAPEINHCGKALWMILFCSNR
jgi:hypothetical protein